jgi:hypothetical protein
MNRSGGDFGRVTKKMIPPRTSTATMTTTTIHQGNGLAAEVAEA